MHLLGVQQIVQLEFELLSEAAQLPVPRVDQLAAVLVDLAVSEVPATRIAAPADPPGSLVDLRDISGLLETVGAGESGEPRPDDRDPRRTAPHLRAG